MLTGQFLELATRLNPPAPTPASDAYITRRCPAGNGSIATAELPAEVDVLFAKKGDLYEIAALYNASSNLSTSAAWTIGIPNDIRVVVSQSCSATYFTTTSRSSTGRLYVSTANSYRLFLTVSPVAYNNIGAYITANIRGDTGLLLFSDGYDTGPDVSRLTTSLLPSSSASYARGLKGAKIVDGVFTANATAANEVWGYFAQSWDRYGTNTHKPWDTAYGAAPELFFSIQDSESGALLVSYTDLQNNAPGSDIRCSWLPDILKMAYSIALNDKTLIPGHEVLMIHANAGSATVTRQNLATARLCVSVVDDVAALATAGLTCASVDAGTMQNSALALTFIDHNSNIVTATGKYRVVPLI